jgi:hypothetical protein
MTKEPRIAAGRSSAELSIYLSVCLVHLGKEEGREEDGERTIQGLGFRSKIKVQLLKMKMKMKKKKASKDTLN